MTMSLVQTVTVGSGGQSSIVFDNIPQDSTDLFLLVNSRLTGSYTALELWIGFNTDTNNNNSSGRFLLGTGSAASSSTNLGIIGDLPGASATASTFGNVAAYIPNYTGSTNKSFSADSVTENNATAVRTRLYAGLWNNTAAITKITLWPEATNFAEHSTASLYKITKA